MSKRMQRASRDFARVLEDAHRTYYEDRWRRRSWWAFDTFIVPAMVVPAGLYGFGFTLVKPPGVPSLFGVIIALSLCLLRGGILAGWIAWGLTAGVLAWDLYIHDNPLSDYKNWLTLALLGYASVLVAYYFRGSPKNRLAVPKRGSAFFRKPPSARHQPLSHADDNRLVPHRYMLAPISSLSLSAPKSAILQQYFLHFRKRLSAD
jgi:hypothetical protein